MKSTNQLSKYNDVGVISGLASSLEEGSFDLYDHVLCLLEAVLQLMTCITFIDNVTLYRLGLGFLDDNNDLVPQTRLHSMAS